MTVSLSALCVSCVYYVVFPLSLVAAGWIRPYSVYYDFILNALLYFFSCRFTVWRYFFVSLGCLVKRPFLGGGGTRIKKYAAAEPIY